MRDFRAPCISVLFILVGHLVGSMPLHAQDTLLVDFKLFHGSIDRISDDGHGNICLSTGLGIYLFDGKSVRWVRSNPNRELYIFISKKISLIQEPEKQKLYAKDERLKKIWEKFLPLTSAQVISEAKDKQGRTWVSNGQYLYCFEINKKFQLSYRGKSIRGILPLGDSLIVSTYSGVYINEYRILFDSLYSHGHLFRYQEDEVLIPYGKLIAYQLAKHSYRYIPCKVPEGEIIQFLNFSVLNNELYAATTTGLMKLENDTLVRTNIQFPLEELFVYQDQIFLASVSGIYTTYNGETYTQLKAFPNLPFNSIQNIQGIWWATSKEGIWKWEPGTEKAVQIFKNQELSNLETYNLLQDQYGYFWVSCVSGIVRFRANSESYEHYLRQIEFNKRSAAIIGDTMYFGSLNGLFNFHPSQFRAIQKASKTSNYSALWLILLLITLLGVLGFFTFLLYRKWKRISHLLEASLVQQEPISEPFIEELEIYIIENIRHVTVESLISYTGLSRRGLYQILEKTYRTTPGDLIRNIKQNKIQEILESNPTISTENLAEMVGYSSAYITRMLKKE